MNLVWRKGGGDTGFVDIAFDPFRMAVAVKCPASDHAGQLLRHVWRQDSNSGRLRRIPDIRLVCFILAGCQSIRKTIGDVRWSECPVRHECTIAHLARLRVIDEPCTLIEAVIQGVIGQSGCRASSVVDLAGAHEHRDAKCCNGRP